MLGKLGNVTDVVHIPLSLSPVSCNHNSFHNCNLDFSISETIGPCFLNYYSPCPNKTKEQTENTFP
jgi:hypothetical protein